MNMIDLLITSDPIGNNLPCGKSYSAVLEPVNSDNNALQERFANAQYLNILLPQSKVMKLIETPAGEKCHLQLNIITYPDDDSIIPIESVLAIGKLSKTKYDLLKYISMGETIEEIARKKCRAMNTINRHMQDMRSLTDLHTTVKLNFAFMRFLIEFFRPNKSYRKPQSSRRIAKLRA